MNNEIATASDDTALSLLPPAKAPAAGAREMLLSHAAMMQTAYDLAVPLVKTEMVPARYRNKPEDATAAILYGAELGLSPIQALQNVFAVHGTPAIYARTMGALLKARGYKLRTIERTAEAAEIHGWEPGRDPDTAAPDETSRWTYADAERAEYTKRSPNKPDVPSKYETEPRAMLYAKALAEVCRHLAPDVLLGISFGVEELELDTRRPLLLTSRPAPITVDEILTPPEPTPDAGLTADKSGQGTAEHGTPPPAPANPEQLPEPPRKKRGRPRKTAAASDTPANPEPPDMRPSAVKERIAAAEAERAAIAEAREAAKAAAAARHQTHSAEEPADDDRAPGPDQLAFGESGEELITKPQLTKLHILLNETGLGDRDAGLAWLSAAAGRPIETSKALTKNEATRIIDTLEYDIEGQPRDEPPS